MRAKKFLQQVEKLDKMIENKMAEKALWEAVAMGITPQTGGERVQSSGSQHRMADAIEKYIDIEKEIKERMEERKAIIAVIEQLDAVEYDILHKVYVLHRELMDVAEDRGRSYSWITTMHGAALAKVQIILDGKGNEKEV